MSAAVISIIILSVCVVLYVTEWIPIVTTSILGCTAMVVFNVITFSQAFGGFASDTVFLVLGVLTLGNAMFEVGAAQLLGRGIVKVAGSNERLLLGVSMATAATLSAFLANTATTAMFIALLAGVCATNPDLKIKNMLMPIGMAAVAGGVCTLVGSTPQVVAQGILLEQLGSGFSMFSFTPVGAPICIAMIAYFLFIGYPMGKKVWGDRIDEGVAVSTTPTDENTQFNYTKIATILVIFALTIVGFVTGYFSLGTTCMLSALACLLTGCIDVKTTFAKMDWVSIGVLGGSLGIANGLAISGGGKLIADAFIGLVGMDAAPFAIFCAIVFITMALSQFMSNTASVAMLVPIALFICTDMGLNPFAFAMGIVVVANMSFCTPIATTPLTMTLVGGYRFMDYVKLGGAFNIIALFLVIALVPIFFPLIV